MLWRCVEMEDAALGKLWRNCCAHIYTQFQHIIIHSFSRKQHYPTQTLYSKFNKGRCTVRKSSERKGISNVYKLTCLLTHNLISKNSSKIQMHFLLLSEFLGRVARLQLFCYLFCPCTSAYTQTFSLLPANTSIFSLILFTFPTRARSLAKELYKHCTPFVRTVDVVSVSCVQTILFVQIASM